MNLITKLNNACSQLKYMLFVLFLLAISPVYGQGIPSGDPGASPSDSSRSASFAPIPFVSYDRSLGFYIGAVPLMMYHVNKADTLSPKSASGVFGMYTTNGSWFLIGFNKWYVNNDNYRIVLAGGRADVNFQFYVDPPVAGFIEYNTAAWFAKLEVQRRIISKLYGGGGYTYIDFNTKFNESDTLQSQTALHGLDLVLSYDGRDDVYYPYKGFLTEINFTTYPESFGNDFVSNKIEIEYNQYWSIKERHVFAGRLYTGLGIGDLSFNQQFIIGQKDIRGYTQGEYRGDQIMALQGEYRHNFKNRFGFVGFASIFNSVNKEQNGQILPGVGAGVRYTILPDEHMNMGMDVAVGKNDWGIYFRIGESF